MSLASFPSKGVIWYSDGLPDPAILDLSRRTVERSGLPIAAVSLRPLDWPAAKCIVLDLPRGPLTMFRQILVALEMLTADVAFFCEHDVAYSVSHFEFTPQRDDVFYYNENVWQVRASDGHALHYPCNKVSGLCANREFLIKHYRRRIAKVERDGFSMRMGYEPGTHHRPERVDNYKCASWRSAVPNIDIRHDSNLSPSRWSKEEFRNKRYTEGWIEGGDVPGWGRTGGRFPEFLRDLSREVAV